MRFPFLVVSVFFSGCIGSSHYEKIKDSYYLSALDSDEDMEIVYRDENGYMFTIVGSTVFAVGYSEEFIVAKQHPRSFPNHPDKNILNYFIIPLKNKISNSVEKNVIGPITLKQFEEKSKLLPIGNINFSVLKELDNPPSR